MEAWYSLAGLLVLFVYCLPSVELCKSLSALCFFYIRWDKLKEKKKRLYWKKPPALSIGQLWTNGSNLSDLALWPGEGLPITFRILSLFFLTLGLASPDPILGCKIQLCQNYHLLTHAMRCARCWGGYEKKENKSLVSKSSQSNGEVRNLTQGRMS